MSIVSNPINPAGAVVHSKFKVLLCPFIKNAKLCRKIEPLCRYLFRTTNMVRAVEISERKSTEEVKVIIAQR